MINHSLNLYKKRKPETLTGKTVNGGVAQLGEHLLCKQGVRSSILLISTTGHEKGKRTAEILTEWAHSSGG